MTTPPPLPGRGLRRNLPVFLSALVYPGAGQIAQGKWLLGLLFMVGFSSMIFPALYILIKVNYTNLQNVIHYDLNKEFVEPPMGRILLMMFGTMLIYIINIVDAWRRSMRTIKNEHSMPPTPRSGAPGPE